MKPTLLRRALTATAVALVALPAAAFAADTVHETSAFRVTAPDDWSVKQLDGQEGAKTGHWLLKSPSGNRKLYVFISAAKSKQTVKSAFNAYVGTELRKYVRHARIQSYHEQALKGGQAALGFVYGASKRTVHARPYKAAVFVAHRDGGERVIHAALAGSEEAWGKTALRVQTILGSIGLK